MEVSLIFSCMNLKKLANWIWRDTFGLVRRMPILMNFHIFYLYIIKMVPFVLVIGTICLQTEITDYWIGYFFNCKEIINYSIC